MDHCCPGEHVAAGYGAAAVAWAPPWLLGSGARLLPSKVIVAPWAVADSPVLA